MIYLFQHGAPSQLDLFDYKPNLAKLRGTELPDSVRMGQRLTGMTSYQTTFPTAPSIFRFASAAVNRAPGSANCCPTPQKIADDICVIRSLQTDAINHDPAVTFFQTGFQLAGRPSIGAWISYGLGSENQDLPAFVVMVSQGGGNSQALADRQWGSGFLPTSYQGVKFRSGADPVLYLVEPAGYSSEARRRFLDDLAKLNAMTLRELSGPGDFHAHRAIRDGVPDANLGARVDGSFERAGVHVSSCTARIHASRAPMPPTAFWRAAWPSAACASSSSSIAAGTSTAICRSEIRGQCLQTDQPSAALIQDLKQRGMLDDTLVVWGGEFGRTVYSQGTLTEENYGRDHHPRCFSIWMAGGGIKRGLTYGETDDYLLQHRERSGGRARSARDDPALPGRGSHEADIQVPGPPFPFDRREGQPGPPDHGVIFFGCAKSQIEPV